VQKVCAERLRKGCAKGLHARSARAVCTIVRGVRGVQGVRAVWLA
jgi:hypothetical protein